MPTQEVLSQWEASSPTIKSEGPLQGTTNPPQSLVSKHECFAIPLNAEASRRKTKGFQQDRVRNSGARTPGSIHADIVAQIEAKRERKASGEAEKEKKEAEVEKST
ncbi:hypothetical protein J7337_010475 [Fusarium musae]|uniref:Uncharacterized protein n=1 Tax=Fusarium musae TaxID=1042133 RepID=A0A9P8IL88_9HYPO|nr:hypothetical protein J7337_010475 [Fusarium musae]KAG9497614.1 hypothetical protein J7337_010475 [Fusarium musae]